MGFAGVFQWSIHLPILLICVYFLLPFMVSGLVHDVDVIDLLPESHLKESLIEQRLKTPGRHVIRGNEIEVSDEGRIEI